MNSEDVQKPTNSSIPLTQGRKPYVAPTSKRVSPEAAKELLLRHADPDDPEVQRMHESIEEINKHSGS